MVLQTLAHAVGAANILATTPFVQQIVWDGISTLGLLWEQAYCLVIIYLEAIEDSRGVLHVANVFAAGAQDTRLKAANKRYSEIFASHATIRRSMTRIVTRAPRNGTIRILPMPMVFARLTTLRMPLTLLNISIWMARANSGMCATTGVLERAPVECARGTIRIILAPTPTRPTPSPPRRRLGTRCRAPHVRMV